MVALWMGWLALGWVSRLPRAGWVVGRARLCVPSSPLGCGLAVRGYDKALDRLLRPNPA